MSIYVPYNYIKLYSSQRQSIQTMSILKQYSSKDDIITDATSGIGGNAVEFCKHFFHVNCVEINHKACKILSSNLSNFTNVSYYNLDYLNVYKTLQQDIIFIDPPWEFNYKEKLSSDLYLSGIHINFILEELAGSASYIFLKCPLNFSCIPRNLDFITHYIYNKRTPKYKIIVFYRIKD
jgi:16S rRNA G966 N2-methylase RsmD